MRQAEKDVDGEKQMNKLIVPILLCSIASNAIFSSYDYNGSTIAAVTLAGGIISAQHSTIEKKYKRKDCPVCKGKGWYISGDDITKVPCGYCEPDTDQAPTAKSQVKIKKCNNPNCKCVNCDCKNCGCLLPIIK